MTVDLSQPCPDEECAEESCTLYECCYATCDCEQAREDGSYSRVVDYYDDGTVQRYCGEHKSEWIADR